MKCVLTGREYADKELSNLTDYQRALYNIGGKPRKNLIDNPRFKINQNGDNIPDRYMSSYNANTILVSLNGLEVNTGTRMGENYTHQLLRDEELSLMLGKKITISAIFTIPETSKQYFRTRTVTCVESLNTDANTIITSLELYRDSEGKSIIIYITNSSYGNNPATRSEMSVTFYNYRIPIIIHAVKLEIGDTQTLAYQDSNGEWQLFDDYDYMEDLANCNAHHYELEGTYLGQEFAHKTGCVPLSHGDAHNAIYRGKNLGTEVTEAQLNAINNGTFDDLYIGDYWVMGGHNWRICHFDYWLNTGDEVCTKHHVVIMPDNILYAMQMNETNTTEGGYVGSLMYTQNLATAKSTITSAFGDLVLTHRELLTNAVTNGYPSAGAWYDSSVELPNEIMMYGSYVFTPAGDGSFVPYRYTINKSQLALFRLVPRLITNRSWYWLRDVVSSASFAYVYGDGSTASYSASNSGGVRPVFPICKPDTTTTTEEETE